MDDENLIMNYVQLIEGIELSLQHKLPIPALILIYSGIDSVSWLASAIEDQSVGEAFQEWVNKWMLKQSNLSCTAEELYSARCGLLHTLTPNSNFTEKKGVRRIAYAWGTAKQEEIEESINILQYPDLVSIHINDLFHSFRNGFAEYLDMLDNNPALKDLYILKAKKHFVTTDISIVSAFLAAAREAGTNTVSG